MKNVLENRLSPLIKYPGGKEKELNYILPALPREISHYYEPFVGGGAVYFAISAEKYYINDKSDELVSLYEMVKEQNAVFFDKLNAIDCDWNTISRLIDDHAEAIIAFYRRFQMGASKRQIEEAIRKFVLANTEAFHDILKANFEAEIETYIDELGKSIYQKMKRMQKIEKEKGKLTNQDIVANIEAASKAAFYTHFRMLINYRQELGISREFAAAIYFFIRQVCYSSMFRYNREGKFNVPYGGISYNRKAFANKIADYQNEDVIRHLADTTIGNMDFYEFMQQYPPQKNDFVFVDPPYDSEFSTYAQNEFGKDDQARLADYLIHECQANFMIVIKNTDYIASLYREGTKTVNGRQLYVSSFDKKYFVSFQDRNDKNAQHLLITNYKMGD